MSPRPERRPQQPTWPWVIGGAATVALLWYVFSGPAPRPEPEVVEAPAADTVQQAVAAPPPRVIPPAVARFAAVVQAPADSARDKSYAVETLHLLADALTEVATVQGVPPEDIEAQANVIRQNADSVQVRTGDHANARRVNAAFTAASTALQRLRSMPPGAAPEDPTAEFGDGAGNVTTALPLSEQGEALQRFLERAATTLRSIAANPAGPGSPR
jgi:hypothetical protein